MAALWKSGSSPFAACRLKNSTVVVSAGFSLLMASQFEVLFLVGLMTVVSALSAVCADLFLISSILGFASRASVRGTRMPNQIREA